MKLTFLGAAHEVTGSCTLVEAAGHRFLVDCGMEQGRDTYENEDLPCAPGEIEAVLITHAHIDHSGRLPYLYKNGFRGPIFATDATTDLCDIMLEDSAHIQEQEAEWKNRKAQRSGREPVEPDYTVQDALAVMEQFAPQPYGKPVEVLDGVEATFTDVGHLLGSASITLRIRENGRTETIVFSGDIGNRNQPMLRDPQYLTTADYVVMESTYGNRSHGPKPDYVGELAAVIQRTFDRGGNVVIPSFAVGRTQEMLYFIRQIKAEGRVKGHGEFEVYVDSPLANKSTTIFRENYSECFDQEALDLVEFANGGADTVWGRVRAEMGHPKPFGLEYLGVGNEQWEDRGNEFYKRFELFEKRIHEKYPTLKIIGTVGPTVDTPSHKSAWEWTKENLAKNPDFVYASDEHFYASPEWLYQHADMYDDYPSNCRVYAGEYAAHVPGSGCAGFNAPQANVWEGALAEAAFMTGMERNSDIVVMSSYAPLFGRLGYTQWSPDLIWFDGKRAYATVNYYVQQLFSLFTGNVVLNTEAEGGLYASATELEGLVYVKVVNPSDKEVEAEFEGDFDFGALTRIIRMAGDPAVYNTIDEPEKLVPEDVAPTAPRSLTLPPHSFHVLIFHK